MKFYRQYDYPNTELGEYGKITLKNAGCFVVSLANMANVDPVIANAELAKNNCFVRGNMLANKSLAAELLGLKWHGGPLYKAPKHICIAETADNAKIGIPQHFFVYNPETKEMNDPMSKTRGWEKNTYKIKSYRQFDAMNIAEVPTEEVKPGISPYTTKEALQEALKIQKDIFDYVYDQRDTKKRQAALEKITLTGRYIREAQERIGLNISK